MSAFWKISLVLSLPIVGYFSPWLVIPFVSTASSAASEFSMENLIIPVILLGLSIGTSYLISKIIYPRMKSQFEKEYQDRWVKGLLPVMLGAVLTGVGLYFNYKSCNFFGPGPECQPVTSSMKALFIQISNNGLHLRQPHIEGMAHVTSFLGYWVSSTLVIQEVISRAIFYLKN